MNSFVLVYPMGAMVLLTFCVLVALFRVRVKSVASGEISSRYFRTYQGEQESDKSLQLSRHFANIFEAPTLFYVVCLAAMIAHQVTTVMVVLAWLYVGLRALHAYVHTGSNRLKNRIRVYFGSWIVLLAMWIILTIGVFISTGTVSQ